MGGTVLRVVQVVPAAPREALVLSWIPFPFRTCSLFVNSRKRERKKNAPEARDANASRAPVIVIVAAVAVGVAAVVICRVMLFLLTRC